MNLQCTLLFNYRVKIIILMVVLIVGMAFYGSVEIIHRREAKDT